MHHTKVAFLSWIFYDFFLQAKKTKLFRNKKNTRFARADSYLNFLYFLHLFDFIVNCFECLSLLRLLDLLLF